MWGTRFVDAVRPGPPASYTDDEQDHVIEQPTQFPPTDNLAGL